MKRACLLSLFAVVLCGAAADARARLGETPEACAERYGPPLVIKHEKTAGGDLTLVYRKNGCDITINFKDGLANALIFKKMDRTGFSDAEAQALLAENRGEWTWSVPERYWGPKHDPVHVWGRTDGARAVCPRDGDKKDEFALLSHDCWEKFQADKRAKEKAEKDNEWDYDNG